VAPTGKKDETARLISDILGTMTIHLEARKKGLDNRDVLSYSVNVMTHSPMPGLKRQKPHVVVGRTELLNGRREGRELAERLLAQLAASEPDSILPVAFGQVRFMDFSCADELLTRALRRIRSGELGTRFILLQGLSPSVEENLAAVCAIRDLVCPKLTKGGQIELLGKIGPELTETYHLGVRKGTISARDVMAIAPDVGASAISNRLAKLQSMGLLIRTKEGALAGGGRQFVYLAVC